jgi:hypothetical protein
MLRLGLVGLLCSLVLASLSEARGGDSCEETIRHLNQKLRPAVDADELLDIVRELNRSNNRRLPEKFIDKRQARMIGWRPGSDLWMLQGGRGKSIGGDRYHDRERRLPQSNGSWREADLDYKGGKRGAKRLIFSSDNKRMVTVDHYRTFTEVPPCR